MDILPLEILALIMRPLDWNSILTLASVSKRIRAQVSAYFGVATLGPVYISGNNGLQCISRSEFHHLDLTTVRLLRYSTVHGLSVPYTLANYSVTCLDAPLDDIPIFWDALQNKMRLQPPTTTAATWDSSWYPSPHAAVTFFKNSQFTETMMQQMIPIIKHWNAHTIHWYIFYATCMIMYDHQFSFPAEFYSQVPTAYINQDIIDARYQFLWSDPWIDYYREAWPKVDEETRRWNSLYAVR
jgi:hypothetical protein